MTKILTSLHQCDKTGEMYLRYKPAIIGGPMVSGTISFAVFDVAVHAPESEHKAAIALASKSAAEVLRLMATDMERTIHASV